MRAILALILLRSASLRLVDSQTTILGYNFDASNLVPYVGTGTTRLLVAGCVTPAGYLSPGSLASARTYASYCWHTTTQKL